MNRLWFVICLVIVPLFSMAIDDKDIKKSIEKQRFRNVEMEVLRVKNKRIDSPAKDMIKKVQNSLDNCYKLLGQEQDIQYELVDIKNNIDKIRLKDISWPVSYYEKEVEMMTLWNINASEPIGSKEVTDESHFDKAGQEYQEQIAAFIAGDSMDDVTSEQEKVLVENDKKITTDTTQHFDDELSTDDTSPSHDELLQELSQDKIEAEQRHKEDNERVAQNTSTSNGGMSSDNKSNSNTHNSSENDTSLILLLLAGVALWITYLRFRSKCSNCGRWNAMRTYNKRYDYREKTSYDKEKRRWNYIYHFTYYRECKHCGYRDAVERTKSTKSWYS